MKFSKLPKEKRDHLILVAVGGLAIIAALWFGVIKSQQDKLVQLATQQDTARAKLKDMEEALKRASLVESTLNQASQVLAEKEATMATGDRFSWMYNTVRRFQKNYKQVDIPQLSPVSEPTSVNLIPDMAYKQATMQIGGTTFYHDLGEFVADLENTYPLMRVANLTVELNRSPAPGEPEKLSFKMDLITLVKPSQP